MNDARIFDEELLLNRRYGSFVFKTRRTWTCQRCGLVIEKGGQIEHSYAPDMGFTIELCMPCVLILGEKKV